MQPFERMLGHLAQQAHRRPWVALLAAGLLLALGAVSARRLSLNADLSHLLPRSFQSVRDLDTLEQRFGGIGWVVVVGREASPENLRRFVDEMAPQLEALPGVRYVEQRRSAEFFVDRALLYLDLADLEEVERRVQAREKWERRQRNPLLLKLDDEPPPPLDFSDIEKRYATSASRKLAGGGEDYYLDARERMAFLLVKPEGISADLGFAERIVGQIEAFLKGQDLSRYGPDFRVELTGTFKKKLDQKRQITTDLAAASSAAGLLMLLYLLLHFRSGFAVALVLLPTSAGLVWTYGFVGAAYGTVNLLTAFLGAILGGLGTEHGMHLIGRYTALRRDGRGSQEAIGEAMSHSGVSAVVSATVAALTFLSLAISEFRAFREFGVIAAVGMLLVVGAYLLILPALLGLLDRFGWKPRAPLAVSGARSPLARWLPRAARPVALGLGPALVLLALAGTGVRFNYSFAALEDSSLPSFELDRAVNRIIGYSQTPVVILTDTEEQERHLVRAIQKRKAELGDRSTLDFAAALGDLVPEQQEEKRRILARLERSLARVDREDLAPEEAQAFDLAQRVVRAQPFTREDLPLSVRRQFGSGSGGFVLAFPGVSMNDGENVRRMAAEVRSLSLPDGTPAPVSGENMVLADILDMVTRESGPVLAAAFILVLLALWLTLGGLREALICLSPTVFSILGLLGVMAVSDIRFNFLNIVAIPVLIGTTVDAGVHLMGRLREADGERFASVLGETGRAICGGLLTSAVGFGALCIADHPGLRSLGVVTILGFSVNLIVMLVGFPAALYLLRRIRVPAGPDEVR